MRKWEKEVQLHNFIVVTLPEPALTLFNKQQYARPSLPVNPNTNLNPPHQYRTQLHKTAANTPKVILTTPSQIPKSKKSNVGILVYSDGYCMWFQFCCFICKIVVHIGLNFLNFELDPSLSPNSLHLDIFSESIFFPVFCRALRPRCFSQLASIAYSSTGIPSRYVKLHLRKTLL